MAWCKVWFGLCSMPSFDLTVSWRRSFENGDRLRLPIWVVRKGDLVLQDCAHPDV